MKFIKCLSFAMIVGAFSLLAVGCGLSDVDIVLGTYNDTNNTFTAVNAEDAYSLEQNGNTLVLKGTIPYSAATLNLEAGNIVAIKFTPVGEIVPDEETSIQTTNSENETGWNVYDQSALEEDGSLIWVTNVSKNDDVQIKIKWNQDYDEVTFTLTVDDTATLASE